MLIWALHAKMTDLLVVAAELSVKNCIEFWSREVCSSNGTYLFEPFSDYYYKYLKYSSVFVVFFCISVVLCCLLEASARCRELLLYLYSSAVLVSSRSSGAFGASAPAPSAPWDIY